MPRKRKPAHQLTDKELKNRLFPGHIRKQLKTLVKALDVQNSQRQQKKKA